jgi:pimeloyl-ACP methyl ester carboxylesterase
VPYLDRDGVAIYYEVHGPAPEDGGPSPVLLSHGYSATADMWKPNLDAISADRPVITWDIRGHGRSDSPDDPASYSESLSLGDMVALLDQFGVATAAVGGLSLGGYLSLAFHLEHPGRVAALMIFDAGPGYRKDGPREEWNAMARRRGEVFEERGLDALGDTPEVRVSQHTSASGLALAARGILVQHDARVIESLPTISVPTLILVGSDDQPFLAAADVMAAKIPGATKVVIEHAGHASNIDQPEAFNSAVLGFLGSF